jgi:type II secretory pathway pseudopilin PulG
MGYLDPINRRSQRCRAAFTLIETAMAMVIVGLAVGGILQLLAAGSQSNLIAAEKSIGINLAKNVREIANGLAYQDPSNPSSPNTNRNNLASANDIWDLDGLNLSPPVDCRGVAMTAYANWSQQVSVQTVSTNDLKSNRPQDPTVPTALITVNILHGTQSVYTMKWLVCAPDSAYPPGP